MNVLPRSVEFETTAGGETADEIVVAGQDFELHWIGEGTLGRVQELLGRRPPRSTIVVARHLSPGAREALSEAGIGWVDETGAAEIAAPGLIVLSIEVVSSGR
ncbi:hypothetical protein [Candidatus Poriferisocius sp.]|uniref:hypothetical protein n=1 Tax=Candidatus Poriferisocius sp. TaxID=3101276 RepID=UPI003B5CCDD0